MNIPPPDEPSATSGEVRVFISKNVMKLLDKKRVQLIEPHDYIVAPAQRNARQILDMLEGVLDGVKCRLISANYAGVLDWEVQVTSVRRSWSETNSGRIGHWILSLIHGIEPEPAKSCSRSMRRSGSFVERPSAALTAVPTPGVALDEPAVSVSAVTLDPPDVSLADSARRLAEPLRYARKQTHDEIMAAMEVLTHQGWGTAAELRDWKVSKEMKTSLKVLKVRITAKLHDIFRSNRTQGMIQLRGRILEAVDDNDVETILDALCLAPGLVLSDVCDLTARVLILKVFILCDNFRVQSGLPKRYLSVHPNEGYIQAVDGSFKLLKILRNGDGKRSLEIVAPEFLAPDDPLLECLPQVLRPLFDHVRSCLPAPIPPSITSAAYVPTPHMTVDGDAEGTLPPSVEESRTVMEVDCIDDAECQPLRPPVDEDEEVQECGGEGNCLFLCYAFLVHGFRTSGPVAIKKRQVRDRAAFVFVDKL
jgi:hypothetical protein